MRRLPPMRRLPLMVSLVAALAVASTIVLYMQNRDAAGATLLSRALDRAGAFAVAAGTANVDDGVLQRMATALRTESITHACVYTRRGEPLCPEPSTSVSAEHAEAMTRAALQAAEPGQRPYATWEGGAAGYELWYAVKAGASGSAPGPLGPGPRSSGDRVLLLIVDSAAASRLVSHTLAHAVLITVLLGVLILLTFRQVRSAAKERELERQAASERRFAELGRLSAVLAHEIRNPLGAIKGFAQYNGERLPDGDPSKADMETIVAESTRLERLVKTLLSYARPRPPEPKLQDLRALIERVSRICSHEAGELDVPVKIDLPEAPVMASVDTEQLTQALINLVSNAIQAAAEEGGGVEVALRQLEGGAEIVVSDTGAGLDPSIRDTLFEPYVTGKAKGTGLGLAVTRRVIEAHNGLIEVDSEPGEGARFTVVLPDAGMA